MYYVLAAPGTAIHEIAHAFAVIALLGPRGIAGFSLFRPHTDAQGRQILGFVRHRATDPVRSFLTCLAPLPFGAGLLFAFLVVFNVGLPDTENPFESAALRFG